MKPIYVLSFLLLCTITSNLMAEGTKELAPNPTDVAFLHFWRANQLEFAAYDGAADNRITIRANSGEIIYFGFKEKLFDPLDTIPVFFRIKDPNGNIVHGPVQIPKSGVGYINNYTQAVAGPNVLAAGGYPALSFTPTSGSGNYYIEFNRGDSTIQQQDEFYLEFFDITVANAVTNTAISGRVCSKNWQISTDDLANPFNGSFYVYSTDSIVTKLNLNGVKPFKFNIYCNSFGLIDTTDLFFARASDDIRVLNPEYCLFLNDPDHNEFPTGIPARITGDPPNLTCESGQFYINATFTKAGVAEILINLNGIPGFQPNSEDVRIGRRSNQVVAGLNKFLWDGLDGLGNVVNYNVNIEIKTTIQSGYTNFPIFDPEENPNGFDVDLIRPTGSKPLLYWDDSTHLANIGGTIETDGCLNNCHQWLTATLGDGNTLNTYWAGIADTLSFNTLFRGCMPVAVNDTIPCFSEDSLTQLVVRPFHNDSDPDDNLDTTSTRIIVGSSLGNTVSVNSQGQVLYDLLPHFNGKDSLTYEICDATNLCDTATIYICVSPVADLPIAVDDTVCIPHNQSMTYAILNNDADVDGTIDVNSVTLIDMPQNGTISLSSGVITYVPNLDFIGQDTITYQVKDDEGNLSNIASIFITVDHTIPNAVTDTVSTLMNNSVSSNVLTNDSDSDNSPFTLSTTPTLAPSNGQVAILPNGDFTYIPNTNFSGIDSFHYELITLSICDGTLSLSTKGTVIINVLDACLTGCQSVAPTAITDSVIIIDGILASINVLNNDFDNNTDSIYVQSVVSNFTKGFGGINLANGDLTYSPAGGMTGFDTLTYRVCDTTGLCAIGSVIIEILPFSNGNKAPIANSDNFTTTSNSTVSFSVLANDADQDPFFNTLSISILQTPSNGNLSSINTSTGAITYTPNTGFTGIDQFTYQVCDNGTPTLCDVATVNIHVIDCTIAPNQPPIARNDTTNTPLNTVKTISILANDTDADGTIDISFTQINNPPKNGILTIDANTGNVVYTPNMGFIGLDSFTYIIRDDANCHAQGKVLINVSFDVITTNSSPVCTGSADVQLMASSSVSGVTFTWYDSNDQLKGTGSTLSIPSTLANAGDYYAIGSLGTISSPPSNITTVQIDTASTAQAGLDKTICNYEIKDTLNAVIPPIGTGSWSSNDPNLLIQDVTDPNTALDNITLATTTLYWTVENGVCSNTDTLTITKNSPITPPTLSDAAFCTGDSVTLNAITTYQNATFSWTSTNGFTSNLPNPVIKNAGIYTVTMKVGECTATSVGSTVTIHPLSAAPILVGNTPCSDENIVLIIPSPDNHTMYRWIAPNGIDTISNSNTVSIFPHDLKYQEGLWQAQSLDVNGCWSAISSTNITIKTKPTKPIVWSNPICEGETLQLFTDTVVGATYHWTGPNSSNLQNPTFSGTLQNAGLFQLQTEVNGCFSDPSFITAVINPLPDINLQQVGSCQGDTILLQTNMVTDATFSWSFGGSVILQGQNKNIDTIFNAQPSDAGIYKLVVTTNANCIDSVITTLNLLSQPPTPTIVGDTICRGEDLVLSTTPNGNLFEWLLPDNTTLDTAASQLILGNNSVLYQSGQWRVRVKNNSGTCVSDFSAPANVLIKDLPASATPTANDACEGATITLSATSLLLNPTYIWTGPNGFIDTVANTSTISNATPNNSGLYEVAVNVDGCTSSKEGINVNVHPSSPAPILVSNQPCFGENLVLTIPSPNNHIQYKWTAPNGIDTISNSNSITLFTNDLNYQTGLWQAQSLDANGCWSDTASTNITIKSKPTTPMVWSNPICEGEVLQLFTDTVTGANYHWTGIDSSNLQNPTFSGTLQNAGLYQLQTKINGCFSDPSSVTAVVNPLPDINLQQVGSCQGEMILLQTDPVIGATFSWQFNGDTILQGQNNNIDTIFNAQSSDEGIYKLVVTTSANCRDSAITALNLISQPLTPTIFGDTICRGEDLVIATMPSGNSFEWLLPNNTILDTNINQLIIESSSIHYLSGQWRVRAKDNTGTCFSDYSAPTNVIIKDSITSITTTSTSICEGEDIQLAASFVNNANYTWTGSNGFLDTLNRIITIPNTVIADAGVYEVQITDGNCTSIKEIINVSVHPNPTLLLASSTTCEGDTLILSNNSLSPIDSFFWIRIGDNAVSPNPIWKISDASPTRDTLFQLTITTAAGCTATDSISVNVKHKPITPTIISSDNSLCVGESFNISIQESYGNSATVEWYKDGSFIGNANPFSILAVSISDAGDYTVVVTENGCSSDTSNVVTLTVDDIITPNPTAIYSNSNFCSGGTLTLSASGDPTYNYLWTGSNGFNTPQQNATFIATSINNGQYIVTVTNGACQLVDSVLVDSIRNTLNIPTISISGDSCQNGNTTLSTTPYNGTNVSYIWNLPNGQSNTTTNSPNLPISNTTSIDSGYYDVTVIVDGCDAKSDSVLLSIYPNPTNFSATASTPLCEGETLFLNANNTSSLNTQFEWSNGLMPTNGDATITNISVSDAGLYTLTVTNTFGCTSKDTVSVVIQPRPITPVVNGATLCENEDLTLTANTYSGNSIFYYWAFNNGNIVDTTTNAVNNIDSVNSSYSGMATIMVNVDGCSSLKDSFNLTINPIPTAIATNNTVSSAACEGDNVQFNTSSIGNYNWFGITNTFSSSIQNPFITNATTTDNGIYALIVEQNGCLSDTAFTTVNINTIPITIDLPDIAYCKGSDVSLFIENPQTGVTYTFYDPNISIGIDTLFLSNISLSDIGIYTVIPSIGNCVGDADTFNINVDVVGNPAFAGFDDSLCLDELITLNAIADSTIQGNWFAVNNSNLTIIDPDDPNSLAVDFQEGDNELVWVVSKGACIAYDADTVNIFLHHTPSAEDDLIQDSLGRTLNFSVIDNDDLDNLSWSIQNQSEPEHGQLTNNEDGTFIYQPTQLKKEDKFIYKVWNEDCPMLSDEAEVTIELDGCIYPTIITPNEDGANDVLVFDCPVNRRSIQIFNRYGSEVYKSDDYKNDWKGEWSDGNQLPDGTYFYIVTEDGTTFPPVYLTIIRKRP